MLYPIIIIKENSIIANSKPHSKIFDCIPVDIIDKNETANAYKLYTQHLDQDFVLGFWVGKEISSSLSADIAAFFFLPNFITIDNNKLCILLGANQEILEDAKKKILQFTSVQGFDKIIINCMVTTGDNLPFIIEKTKDTAIFTSTKPLLEHYIESIKAFKVNEIIFYLQHDSISNEQLCTAILETETSIKSSNPHLYDALVQTKALSASYFSLQRKYAAASAELQHYKEHNETMRSGHQAKELQDYYDNQYELLPLWFKKLGSLIKLITGKKAIPSQSNNQKKKTTH